jgi:TPR repeat protein
MYQNGEGVRQDYKKAFEWYERAALQGDAEAQHTLALIYENGTGVKQDFEKARVWHKKAASQGHTTSKYFVENMHRDGADVGKDYDDGIQDGHNIYEELLRERAF